MTTMTMNRTGGVSCMGIFTVLLLGSGFILLVYLYLLGTVFRPNTMSMSGTINVINETELLVANATIIEVVSGHAWTEHGTQVNAAFKCLNDRWSTRSFQTFGFKDTNGTPLKTNLWLCFDGLDWYAIVTTTLEKVGGNRIGRLVTAYAIDKNLFSVVDDFIAVIKDKWLAREINFVIEAGQIFLSPK